MQEFITVQIFNNPNDCYMAKAYLESAEIVCLVQDEIVSQVYPLANNAIGGIKLQVSSEQAEEAVQLLIEGGFAKREDYEIPESMVKAGKVVDWLKGLFGK